MGFSPRIVGKDGKSPVLMSSLPEDLIFSGVGLGLLGKGIGTPQQSPLINPIDKIPSLALEQPFNIES